MTDEVNGAFGERLNCVAPLFIIRRPDNAAHFEKQGPPKKRSTCKTFFFFFFPQEAPRSVQTISQQVLWLLSPVSESLTMTNMAAKHDLSAMAGWY